MPGSRSFAGAALGEVSRGCQEGAEGERAACGNGARIIGSCPLAVAQSHSSASGDAPCEKGRSHGAALMAR